MTDNRAKTAEQIAKEIAEVHCEFPHKGDFCAMRDDITAALETYAREKVEEAEERALAKTYSQGFLDVRREAHAEGYEAARKDLAAIHSAKWSKEDYSKGFKDAIEKAAKIKCCDCDLEISGSILSLLNDQGKEEKR
jgi:hypothetical protein